jgi:hypothetical protein
MTYHEVTATGAEIVAAYTKVPSEGWREVSIDELRGIHKTLTEDTKKFERLGNAVAHQDAKMQMLDAAKALSRTEAGARAFMVKWDGMLGFAATKTPATQI